MIGWMFCWWIEWMKILSVTQIVSKRKHSKIEIPPYSLLPRSSWKTYWLFLCVVFKNKIWGVWTSPGPPIYFTYMRISVIFPAGNFSPADSGRGLCRYYRKPKHPSVVFPFCAVTFHLLCGHTLPYGSVIFHRHLQDWSSIASASVFPNQTSHV